MKRWLRVSGLVTMVLVLGVPAAAAAPPLGPGGIRIHGYLNAYGQYQVSLKLNQAAPEMFTILAAKVYSEPSHTLLCALVDDSAPEGVLNGILSEKPRVMGTGPIGDMEPLFSFEAPPSGDRRIHVEYVIRHNGTVTLSTMADATLSSLDDFDFSVEPLGGGGIRRCGYCGGTFCGCVTCQGPAFTVCCPECTVECSAILCE